MSSSRRAHRHHGLHARRPRRTPTAGFVHRAMRRTSAPAGCRPHTQPHLSSSSATRSGNTRLLRVTQQLERRASPLGTRQRGDAQVRPAHLVQIVVSALMRNPQRAGCAERREHLRGYAAGHVPLGERQGWIDPPGVGPRVPGTQQLAPLVRLKPPPELRDVIELDEAQWHARACCRRCAAGYGAATRRGIHNR